jgi:uncharacterized membrane protein
MPHLFLALHVAAGSLAIVLGAVALLVAKGGWLHRRAGLAFVLAMLAMGISGSILAARHSFTNVNVLGGLVSAYFVTTALTTVRPDSTWMRRLNIGALAAAIGLILAEVRVGLEALAGRVGAADGVPLRGGPLFFMAAITTFAAVGDVRFMRSTAPRGRPRLARHLWRMCFALFIATGSFFSIPDRVRTILPEVFATPPLQLTPMLLPAVVMVYWLWRLRRQSAGRLTVSTTSPDDYDGSSRPDAEVILAAPRRP